MKRLLLSLLAVGIFLPAVSWADKRNTAPLRSPEWYHFWEEEEEVQQQNRIRHGQLREQSRQDKAVIQQRVRTRQRERMQQLRFGR